MAEELITGAQLDEDLKRGGDAKRPAGAVLRAPVTDFEEGLDCTISAEEHAKRLTIPFGASEGQKAPNVRGNFARLTREKNSKGKLETKVVVDRVANLEGFKDWLRDDATKVSRVLELDAFATGQDSLTSALTGGFPPNNEYIPIMGGPFSKQQYLYDYLSMHAKCFETKNHNPLAKEAVDIITFFTISKGVTLKFNNRDLQAAWEIFEKRNRFQQFIRMDSDTLTWAGEIMTQKDAFPDGYPRIRHVDPSTVWEIITNVQDIDDAYYFHQQFPTQYQLTYKAGDVSSEYVVNDIPADQMFHVRINAVPGEKRGRSDLFNVLGWLKRFKDYYDARITKAQVEESFCLDVTLKGSQADVTQYVNDPENNKVPRPGDKLVHNEALKYEFLAPNSSSSGNATDGIGEAIRSIVATGMGLSPEYLGVGGKSSTRATSISKSEPSARKFEDRQTLFKGYITDIVEWWKAVCPDLPTKQVREASLGTAKASIRKRDWLGLAKEAAALITLGTITEPIDKGFQIIFPEIATEDRSAKLKDIMTSQAVEYISHERAATMTASELQITDFDYDEEQEQIRQERQDRIEDPLYNGDEDPAKLLLGKGGGPAGPSPDQGGQSGAADGSQASDSAFKQQG